jgi:site-specific DNA-methyltransferase (adenine-specific)
MSVYYRDDYVTLYHADCLTETTWNQADVLVTDPPYGMAYRSGRRKELNEIAGDRNLNVRDEALTLWGNKPALVFGTWKQPRPADVKQLIVWDKRGGAGFSGDLNMVWADITEEIYVMGSGWVGRRRPAIYSIPTLPSNNRPDHPTPKPVALMEQLIMHCPDGVLADPFAGSGATLLAARNMNRHIIGVELDEAYCELIANRLSQQTFDFDIAPAAE